MEEQERIDLNAAVQEVVGLITASRHLPTSDVISQALAVHAPHEGDELRHTLLRNAETLAVAASIASALLDAVCEAAGVPEDRADDVLRSLALRYAEKQVGDAD